MPTKTESAGWEFLSVLGSAYAAIRASKDGEDERLAALVWRHMPLARALVDFALRSPSEFEALWNEHLKEAKPPVTPAPDDGWSMKTYAKAQDGPTAQLQAACDGLHDGDSYFTSVMALGTYDALNTQTGEQRTLVAVAAKLNKDKPEATAVLARRLREVVADLDAVATAAGQRES